MLSLCFVCHGQLCMEGVIIKHAEWYAIKRNIPLKFFFHLCFFFFGLECWYITASTKPEWVKRFGVTGKGEKKKSEQSNGRDLERHCYLPVQLRPSYTYTEPWRPWATAKELWVCSLNGWRIQSLNSTQKKQCALGEHHLRKHLGTGQGPAAEGSCHWGALSHWCASVQRPCESSTKETANTQGQINTTMK